MKEYAKVFILLFICNGLVLFLLTGCNETAKSWGGTTNITLDKGQKLVSMSWKENSLWTITRPMRATEEAEVYTYKEHTTFGLMEGKVVVTEVK